MAAGANCLSEFATTTSQLVYIEGTTYTGAQTTSNTASAGNLRNDTSALLGGSTWRVDETSTGVQQSIIYDTAATISVVAGVVLTSTPAVATVTSSTIVPTAVGQPVGITGSTNVALHGIHFVKSIHSGGFKFDVEVDTPTASAITCTATQFRPKSTSQSYQTAPIISTGPPAVSRRTRSGRRSPPACATSARSSQTPPLSRKTTSGRSICLPRPQRWAGPSPLTSRAL